MAEPLMGASRSLTGSTGFRKDGSFFRKEEGMRENRRGREWPPSWIKDAALLAAHRRGQLFGKLS